MGAKRPRRLTRTGVVWLILIFLPPALVLAGLIAMFWREASKGAVTPKWKKAPPPVTNGMAGAPGGALPASAGLAPGYGPRSLRDRSSLHGPVSHHVARLRSPAMRNVGKDRHPMGEGAPATARAGKGSPPRYLGRERFKFVNVRTAFRPLP